MTDAASEQPGLDLRVLLVRQISSLVWATAQMCAEAGRGDVLAIEASLYRLLAGNCEQKAKMAEALRSERPAPDGEAEGV
jgi:hypothetical protein